MVSTRQQVSYNGDTYVKSGVTIKSLTEISAVISLDNSDNSASGLVLNTIVTDRPIDIYIAYGEGSSFTDDDVTLFFSGKMSHVTEINEREIIIACSALSIDATTTPRIYCAPPLCNHLPAAGTKFGDYILEPAED